MTQQSLDANTEDVQFVRRAFEGCSGEGYGQGPVMPRCASGRRS